MKKLLSLSLLLTACGGGPPATLTQIETEIFNPSCALTTCHKGSSSAASLNLEGRTYSKLVNVQSTQKAGEVLVKPGEPDASWLMTKLRGKPPVTRMPLTGQALDGAQLEMVRSWIAAGAKDD